ncbi:MAG: choice-of-anchor L domain-containing protein [Bacteroidetes bacterium]|nr:choice-of-anchor L domain-containing protein [Bacteroidota bacterium]
MGQLETVLLNKKSNFSRVLCFGILMIAFTFRVAPSFAQLTVSNAQTSIQLAATLAGPGVIVTNVNYIGDPISRGTFSAPATNLGIASGIMLMTGDINDAAGPDSFPSMGQNVSQPGDTALTTLAGAPTFDATILEFDFTPQNDTISFRYVFASEEYPEFVCSTYNDAFGFFISGPGIVGTVNIAQIPLTT